MSIISTKTSMKFKSTSSNTEVTALFGEKPRATITFVDTGENGIPIEKTITMFAGDRVDIKAGDPPTGKCFNNWISSNPSVYFSSKTEGSTKMLCNSDTDTSATVSVAWVPVPALKSVYFSVVERSKYNGECNFDSTDFNKKFTLVLKPTPYQAILPEGNVVYTSDSNAIEIIGNTFTVKKYGRVNITAKIGDYSKTDLISIGEVYGYPSLIYEDDGSSTQYNHSQLAVPGERIARDVDATFGLPSGTYELSGFDIVPSDLALIHPPVAGRSGILFTMPPINNVKITTIYGTKEK